MRISIDRESEIPLYKQIEEYLRKAILAGSLAPDTRLPATRQLSRDLGVNRITIEKAYSELEADGMIFTRVGSGAYVLPPNSFPVLPKLNIEAPWPLWQQEVLSRSELYKKVKLDEMKKVKPHPTPILFDGGIGDTHLFPADEFRRVLQNVIRRDGISALEYGERNGYAPLRSTISHVLANQGLSVFPENILITAGSQQALALVTQLLLKRDDVILVESPTYGGALDLFQAQHLKIIGVPVDERGMQVDKVETLLQQYHPKLIYSIPNFHNPTGTCLSVPRRHKLIALADRYNIPILEDDFVGDLRYEGRAHPALKALDPGGRVIYASTFSKMLMPGLRVGFLAAEGPVYESLVDYKRVADLATSSLIQRALEAYVTIGRYQVHLHRCCQVYRKRRDAMLLALNRYLPADITASTPQGGIFIWLCLSNNLSADKLLPLGIEEGVTFTPGSEFFADKNEGQHYLRLNFVMRPIEEIDEGIKRLGRAIKKLGIEKPG